MSELTSSSRIIPRAFLQTRQPIQPSSSPLNSQDAISTFFGTSSQPKFQLFYFDPNFGPLVPVSPIRYHAVESRLPSSSNVNENLETKKQTTQKEKPTHKLLRGDSELSNLCKKINATINNYKYHIDISFFDSLTHETNREEIKNEFKQEEVKNNLQTLLKAEILTPQQILAILPKLHKDQIAQTFEALVAQKSTFPDLIKKKNVPGKKFSEKDIHQMLENTGLNIGHSIKILADRKETLLALLEREYFSSNAIAAFIQKNGPPTDEVINRLFKLDPKNFNQERKRPRTE